MDVLVGHLSGGGDYKVKKFKDWNAIGKWYEQHHNEYWDDEYGRRPIVVDHLTKQDIKDYGKAKLKVTIVNTSYLDGY